MEPTDLNPPELSDEKLTALLRAAGSGPLPDGGFSARVLAALPPPRRAPLLVRRDWIIGGLAATLVLVLVLRGAAPDLAALPAQAGDFILSLLDEPVGLAVIALTAGALLLTEPDEEALSLRPEN